MTKSKTPNTPIPKKTEDVSALDFETLQKRFDNSQCENESFALATAMYDKDFYKAVKLLPINFDVYTPDTHENPDTPKIPRIEPNRLDFDGKNGVTRHEWSAALVAAKQLKLGAGVTLEVAQVDQVFDKAANIYAQTRKDAAICRVP
jgi:hypothetical protein